MANFSESFTRLRHDLDESHRNRMQLLENLRNETQQRCASMASQLTEQAANRHTEFTSLMTNLRGQVQNIAQQTRTQLANLATDLHQGGAVFQGR